MFVARMGTDDLESLARLPDGNLALDLLAQTVHHSSGGVIQLRIVGDLTNWLKIRLIDNRIPVSDLSKAELVAAIRTDKIPTDRNRIVVFDFSITCNVGLPEGGVKTAVVTGRTWHDRAVRSHPIS
jgi:hypothetical protein